LYKEDVVKLRKSFVILLVDLNDDKEVVEVLEYDLVISLIVNRSLKMTFTAEQEINKT
jgi:hypothetical protein